MLLISSKMSSSQRVLGLPIGLLDMGFHLLINSVCGPGSSVGIATDYGLDGPGSNPGGDEIFCQYRPAMGHTEPPVKWIPGLSRG